MKFTTSKSLTFVLRNSPFYAPVSLEAKGGKLEDSIFRSVVPVHRSVAPGYRSEAPGYRSAVPDFRFKVPSFKSEVPSYKSVAGDFRFKVGDFSLVVALNLLKLRKEKEKWQTLLPTM